MKLHCSHDFVTVDGKVLPRALSLSSMQVFQHVVVFLGESDADRL